MAVDIEYARRGDISIAYTVIGDGPIDLVFGAGLMSHIDLLWGDPHGAAWLRRLASGCRVILFDKPGTGLSDPVTGDPTLDERVEDFVAVLGAAGSSRAVVAGLSEAGPPATLLAATRPDLVEALVLISTSARFTTAEDYVPHLEDHFENLLWRWLWHGAEHWGDGQLLRALSPLFRSNPVYSRLAPAVERACASPAMARSIIRSTRSYDVREPAHAVRVPTLVVGRADEWAPTDCTRDLAERIAGAQLELLPGDEHLCFVDGDDIADAVLRFLDAPARPRHAAERALVTLLYTDLVGSTSAVARSGDERWRSVVGHHDDLTADVVARHGGRVVKTLGDGVLAVFDRPVQAIRCADAVRAGLADVGLEVRAAVHTGECELRGDDVSGIAAHLASRLLSHAGAGEIVVSGTVRDLTLGSGLDFESRGMFELRDVPGWWELLVVTSVALSDLRSAARRPPERRVSSTQHSMGVLDRTIVAATRRAPRITRAVLTGAGRLRRGAAPIPPPPACASRSADPADDPADRDLRP